MSIPVIRTIDREDHPQWQELWAGYNRFYARQVEERVTDRLWTALCDGTGVPHGVVAQASGRLVGFAHYYFVASTSDWAPRCYMQDLYVSPSARGTGAGRKLIEAVYDAADAEGAAQTYWLTQENNVVARQLYDRVARQSGFIKYMR